MKLLLIAASLLLLAACATPSKTVSNDKLKGNWELALFPYSTKTYSDVFGARKPVITFESGTNSVSGNSGCNSFHGRYNIQDSMVTFARNIGITTQMACPGYDEKVFYNALTRVNHYRIAETQLELWQNDKLMMIFVKKQ